MRLERRIWGTTENDLDIILYTLTNDNGASVSLCNIGAGIVSIVVPDKNGKMDDVVLGYRDPMSYFGDGPCAGKIPGRFANRICNGTFRIGNKDYHLVLNTSDGKHHLHGGPEGFANQLWTDEILDKSILFGYISQEGEAGYPGMVLAKVKYTWNNNNELIIELTARSNETTIVNLTNHSYFNLNGEGNGDILEHKLKLNAHNYLVATNELIPTGEIAPVKDTPMDFTEFKQIGADINANFDAIINGKGYDSCWALDNYKENELNHAATLLSDDSGRKVDVYTTQPGIQIYTGNWLNGSPIGKCGRSYKDYEGVAMECQGFPDAPNKPNFPSALLHQGDEYRQIIKFKFSII